MQIISLATQPAVRFGKNNFCGIPENFSRYLFALSYDVSINIHTYVLNIKNFNIVYAVTTFSGIF